MSATEPDENKLLDQLEVLLLNSLFLDPQIPLRTKCEAYINNVGCRRIHILKMIREQIQKHSQRDLGLSNPIDRYGRLCPEVLAAVGLPSVEEAYFEPNAGNDIRTDELYPASVNRFYETAFPEELAYATTLRERPALRLYTVDAPCLIAGPTGFQVIDSSLRSFYPTASPFCYSKFGLPHIRSMDGDVVVLADIFNGSNLCHFLLDWLGRFFSYARAYPDKVSTVRYLCATTAGAMHDLLLDALTATYPVKREQFLFPCRMELFQMRGSVSWFSDAFEANTHPGQLMHDYVVRGLKLLAAQIHKNIELKSLPNHIYISRQDAVRRRVKNESELRATVEKWGYTVVELGQLDFKSQISLVGNATHIVAPHGMGLAHLAFSRTAPPPRVTELFHPAVGTDAYAVLARSIGCQYQYLLGEACSDDTSDFIVPVDHVSASLTWSS